MLDPAPMPLQVRAVTVGPAAAAALTPGVTLRVHSVFPSTVNLRADETGDLVSLAGPRGVAFPHAIALEQEEDFPARGFTAGGLAPLVSGALELPGAAGPLRVELHRARRLPARSLPAIAALGAAHAACRCRLAELQAAAGADLRLAALEGAGPLPSPPAPMEAALTRAARALAAASPAALPRAVAALVGLGPGLTPAGDDFLSGWLAAARATGRPALAGRLGEAIERSLGRTGDVSAFLLRCALRGFWPGPLVDLAAALAGEREGEGIAALEALCELGHSSGADIATGFLFGLAVAAPTSP